MRLEIDSEPFAEVKYFGSDGYAVIVKKNFHSMHALFYYLGSKHRKLSFNVYDDYIMVWGIGQSECYIIANKINQWV